MPGPGSKLTPAQLQQAYQDSLAIVLPLQGDINHLKRLEGQVKDPTVLGNVWYDYVTKKNETPAMKAAVKAYSRLYDLNGTWPQPIRSYQSKVAPGNTAEEYKMPTRPVIPLRLPAPQQMQSMAKNPNYVSMLQRKPGLVPQQPMDVQPQGRTVPMVDNTEKTRWMGPDGVWMNTYPAHLQGGSNWTNPAFEPTNRTNNMWRRQGGPIYGRVQGQPTQQTGDYREYQGEQVPVFDLEGFDVRPFNNLEAPSTGRAENNVLDDPLAMAMFGAFRGAKFLPKQYAGNVMAEMSMGASDVPAKRFPKFESDIYSRYAAHEGRANDVISPGGFSPFDDNSPENIRGKVWDMTKESLFPYSSPYAGSSNRGAHFDFVPKDYVRDMRVTAAKGPPLINEGDIFKSSQEKRDALRDAMHAASEGDYMDAIQRASKYDMSPEGIKRGTMNATIRGDARYMPHNKGLMLPDDRTPGYYTQPGTYEHNRMLQSELNGNPARLLPNNYQVNRHGGYLPQHKFGDFLGRNAGTIGGIVGGAVGTVIAPGVGTTLGASLGSQLGGMAQKEYMENQQQEELNASIQPNIHLANNLMASGGRIRDRHAWAQLARPGGLYEEGGLIQYEGPSHESGGIPVDGNGMPVARPNAIAEVEGGETSLEGYVFSDTLKDKTSGLTFAELSKAIERRYKGRTDKMALESKKREMSRLIASNEEIRIKKDNAMIKRKMGGFLKQYAAGGQFMGLTGQDWLGYGIGNIGNIMAMAQASKPYVRTVAPRNEYAQTISAGPTKLDPTAALLRNTQTYTGTQRDVPGLINGSGQGYLAGRLGAASQKYTADAAVMNQYDNANAQLNEQYKNRLLQLGSNQQQYDWNKQLADQQARFAKWNMMNQAAGAMGQNFESAMNRGMWNKLMGQYGLNQYQPNRDGSFGNYRGRSMMATSQNTEGVLMDEPQYQPQPFTPWGNIPLRRKGGKLYAC